MFAECLSAGMKWRRMFLQRRKLELADLYEEPFTNFGANAVEKLFGESEITELIELTKRLGA
jgi:type I restriction enzyme R subunit